MRRARFEFVEEVVDHLGVRGLAVEHLAAVDPEVPLADHLHQFVAGDAVAVALAPVELLLRLPHRVDGQVLGRVRVEDRGQRVVGEQPGLGEPVVGDEDAPFERFEVLRLPVGEQRIGHLEAFQTGRGRAWGCGAQTGYRTVCRPALEALPKGRKRRPTQRRTTRKNRASRAASAAGGSPRSDGRETVAVGCRRRLGPNRQPNANADWYVTSAATYAKTLM